MTSEEQRPEKPNPLHVGEEIGLYGPSPHHLPGTPQARQQGCLCPDRDKVDRNDHDWFYKSIHGDCPRHKYIPDYVE